MSCFGHLSCPVCQKALLKHANSLICESGHTFDLASKGYVNLLLSKDKHSKDPGDSKEMAQARKHFLDNDYYKSLAEGLCNVINNKLTHHNGDCILLDAGCGDGYYTNTICHSIKDNYSKYAIYGMDISKEAIRLAAGRNKDIGFMVASLFKLPFKNQSIDFLINAFAPASDDEFSRVLKKDGFLITVIPGRNHLIELKSVLYDKPYENDEQGPILPSFKSEEQIRIKHTINIQSSSDLKNLVLMTPYYWKTPKEGLERLDRLPNLETTIEFIIGVHSLI